MANLFQRFADRYPTHWLARSALVRGVWRAALWAARPERVRMRLADYRMELPVRGRRGYARAILLRGAIERAATEAFRAGLRAGMTVVDVGANAGHYTLTAAGRVGAKGEVVAFEPDPGAARILRRNVALNDASHVTVVEKAVARGDGMASFYVDARNAGGHSLVAAATAAPEPARVVPTVSLDSYFEGRTVDVIKVDAQGAEAWIVEGAARLLARSDAALFLEFWPFGLARCGADAAGLLEHLAALGYAPVRLFRGRRANSEACVARLRALAAERDDPHAAVDVLFAKR